jgi:hypothetical protein
LRWHTVLAPYLASLDPSRSRNALLGDVHRGELLSWASVVHRWTWASGAAPDSAALIGRADGELETDDFPGLYDTILVWAPASSALIVVPTHRAGISWRPATDARRWVVELSGTTFHADEVIPLDGDPRQSALWRDA